jgi:hypothetical protein
VATASTVGEGEHSPLMGEEEAIASTLGIVAHRLVGLAFVGDERERELPVGVEGIFLAHLRRRRLGNRRPRSRLIVRTSRRGVVTLSVGGLGDWDQGGEGSEDGNQDHHYQRQLRLEEDPPGRPRPGKHFRAGGRASYDSEKYAPHKRYLLFLATPCGLLLIGTI